MRPSNDYERVIARIVDQIDMEGRLTLSSIQEVVKAVDFMMNGDDGESKREVGLSRRGIRTWMKAFG